jgi:hypothetical protein
VRVIAAQNGYLVQKILKVFPALRCFLHASL